MTSWRDRLGLIVYYDAWCPLCTGAKRRITQWDWLGLIQFVSIREPGAAASIGVDPALLAKRMYARTAGGTVVNGIDAVAAIAGRVLAFLPFWPFLILSGWLGLGNWLYDQVAVRRKIVPVGQCDDGVCPIHRPPS